MSDLSTLPPPLSLDEPRADWPFHAGELEAQVRAGAGSGGNSGNGGGTRGIRTYLPEQHRAFYAELPFMVLGGLDANGQPWATLRVGEPGFVFSPDPETLRIAGHALPGDPLADAWNVGAALGGLGIQFTTRRRNRVNGIVTAAGNGTFTLHVSQSFGNCPKYIQRREPQPLPQPLQRDASARAAAPQRVATALDDADRALITTADTFFIASANLADDAGPARGVDVSHRGGLPGFVRVDDARTLTAPDFKGNRFFNTLGNLVSQPRAGLLFIDFEHGDLLYLAVQAEVIWSGTELDAFAGAERLVRFHIEEVRRSAAVVPFRWSAVEYAAQFAQQRST